MAYKLVVFFIILFFHFNAHADEIERTPSFSISEAEQVIDLIHKDKRFDEQFALCPSDNFARYQSYKDWLGFGSNMNQSQCIKDAQACFKTCTSGDSNACFWMAHILQEHPNPPEEAPQKAFSFACAAGSGDGCTNRGAGLRNQNYPNEILQTWSEEKREQCQYRLFQTGCNKRGYGWGCAMLGQAYFYGEGIEKSTEKALSYFSKACTDDDLDHPSCVFAKQYIEQIEEEN